MSSGVAQAMRAKEASVGGEMLPFARETQIFVGARNFSAIVKLGQSRRSRFAHYCSGPVFLSLAQATAGADCKVQTAKTGRSTRSSKAGAAGRGSDDAAMLFESIDKSVLNQPEIDHRLGWLITKRTTTLARSSISRALKTQRRQPKVPSGSQLWKFVLFPWRVLKKNTYWSSRWDPATWKRA